MKKKSFKSGTINIRKGQEMQTRLLKSYRERAERTISGTLEANDSNGKDACQKTCRIELCLSPFTLGSENNPPGAPY